MSRDLLETELYRVVVAGEQSPYAMPMPQLAWDYEHAVRVAKWHLKQGRMVQLFRCEPEWDVVPVPVDE